MKFNTLLVIIFTALASIQNYAIASERPYIKVSAEGKAKALPDQAEFNVSFRATAPDAELARKSVDNKVQPFLKNLEAYELESQSLDTSQINVYPQYDYYKSKRELRGFQVARTINFRLNQLSQLEDLIKLVTQSDVTEIRELRFLNSNINLLKDEALTNAIRKATKTAETIAEGFNVDLEGIHSVTHISNNLHSAPPALFSRAMSTETAEQTMNYEQKPIEVNASIEVEFNFN